MRKIVLMLSLAIGAFTAVPAHAAGLLQDLFERFDRPPPVVYRYAPAEPQLRFVPMEAPRVMRRPQTVRKATREARPLLQRRHVEVRRIQVRALGPRIASRPAPRVKVAALTPEAVKAVVPGCCRLDAKARVAIDADTTLRNGDAVMTSKGLRIYRGASADGAFVDYRNADIRQEAKTRLGAIERRTGGAEIHSVSALRLAVTKHVTAESAVRGTSVDQAGRVIRVVGP